MSEVIRAAVLRGLSTPFDVTTLDITGPRENEVLVKIAATGICHTDIKVSRGYADVPVPVVLGHEGAGIVETVGAAVDGIAPGDHVVLSFPWCGHCRPCSEGHPAYCDQGQDLSFACQRPGGAPFQENGSRVHGGFFGQSSFATHALASRNNVVPVGKDLPLETLGPLGCGFQTGAGAVLNVLQPRSGQSLAVFGVGNVGLSAVMAAKIAGLDPIIAVDTYDHRLEMATALGATHTVNAGGQPEIVSVIKRLTGGYGIDFSLDTTNRPAVVRQAFLSLANRGTCIHSGGGGKDMCFPGSQLLHGRTVTGIIQGDSHPQSFIPQLLDYHRDGRFPFDRMLTFYDLEQINDAVADMESGKVIKPVVKMGTD